VPPTRLHARVVIATQEDGVSVVLSTNLVLCLHFAVIAKGCQCTFVKAVLRQAVPKEDELRAVHGGRRWA
jgi:hypothetical protein